MCCPNFIGCIYRHHFFRNGQAWLFGTTKGNATTTKGNATTTKGNATKCGCISPQVEKRAVGQRQPGTTKGGCISIKGQSDHQCATHSRGCISPTPKPQTGRPSDSQTETYETVALQRRDDNKVCGQPQENVMEAFGGGRDIICGGCQSRHSRPTPRHNANTTLSAV